jgi:hypothetical protein
MLNSQGQIMTKRNNKLRCTLLASSALIAASLSTAASAQSTIDADGTISVAAALEGFVAATSQLGTDADLTSTVTGSDRAIALTETTAITDTQSLFGNDVNAETRLNQSTATLTVSAPESGTTFTGATVVADGGTPATSIDAGVGIVSLQDSSGLVGTSVGDQSFSALVTSGDNSITLDAPTVSGNVTLGGNQSIADVLVNDAANTITASAGGTGNLDVPVAIANLQVITPGDDGTNDDNVTISASTTASNTVAMGNTNTGLSGDVRIDENTIGARAGANTAVNDLFAGDADGAALGSKTGTLSATALDTGGDIASFVADFAVANLQMLETGTAGDGAVNVSATTVGSVELTLDPGTVTSATPVLSLRSNEILSEAAGNTATNRAIVTTGGLNGVSVGVASAQEATGLGTSDIAASITGNIMISGAGGDATTAGGLLDDTTVDMSGNTIGANAVGNEALNIAAVTSTGSLDGSTGYVTGRQTATDMAVLATVVSGDISANFAEIAGGSFAANGNDVYATAALNTQTNIAQNTGSSAFGASTMASTSRQSISGGSVVSLITSADIGSIGTGASTVPTSISNNSVLASATGNVSTTTISNRSSGFSFTR